MGLRSPLFGFLLGIAFISPWIKSSFSAVDPSLRVERHEDEFLLPPYLRDQTGGILNVVSERKQDESYKRSAKPGEWLEYGDTFSLPDRMGIYVQMNEGLQWVAGGVFQGKLIGGVWDSRNPAYEMKMDRGWMKVWSKSGPFSGAMELKTPQIKIAVKEVVFWISVTALKTEIYVLSGTLKVGEQDCQAEHFYEWSGKPVQLTRTSDQWDFVSLEQKISTLYPNLVKLSHRANEEWLDEVSSKKYAELRAKGWKKSDRFYPKSSVQK